MNAPGLSFEQAPPFSVPLRFFLTAPWFLVLAAALLLWEGPGIFASRWLPAALALTHLFVLGFMAHVMLGALLQILPVVVGVTVPRPGLTATLIHLPLTLGTLALAGAFLGGGPIGFQIASGLLSLGFGVALAAFHLAVWRAPVVTDTVIALRCALGALLITVILGLLLGGYFGWGRLSLPILSLTNLHAAWGLAGWTTLLVAGVAYQVVPMFQMTLPYSQRLSQWFAPLMVALLIAESVLILADWKAMAIWVGAALAVGLSIFAIKTLILLNRRQRKIGDPTLIYWRVSMVSLLASAALWLLTPLVPGWAQAPHLEWLIGIMLIFGFAIAVINGMLYKIVPFLAWFHLQAQLLGQRKPPNMKRLLPETHIRQQFLAYLTALLLLLTAALYPAWFLYPAALALGITGAWLGINLFSVWRIYRRTLREDR
ncbi:MAG TPA: hypothetical protein P5149_09775 [Candidatus Competibacteraceae bacterium]|nr:hypothetical protein [Candidatus Competibacteraceae bacterium]HPF59558.1 hypothetical protein [Candidatus Competibacteraceae bacterium]HRY18680.1 hypothetical protein [Candidatus Competibacteraceae bacterium]